MNDLRLLNQYTKAGSEEAFTRLAERYLNLVYSTCLRELCDAHLAEDATQVVFLLLARKAPTLPRATVLSGWLFHTARLVAKNIRRRERRRSFAERGAVREETIRSTPGRDPDWGTEGDSEWETVEPHLHTALAALRPPERNVLLLRFFEDRTLAEVGAALGLTEDAARMRVMRALGKLRRVLVKSGSAVPVVALAGLLSERAVRASPASCADALPRIAAGGAVAAKASGVLAGWHIHHLAHTVTQAVWKANLKVAAVAIGVGMIGAGTIPLVLHRLHPSPPTPSMRLSVGARTKPQAAQEAIPLSAPQQKQAAGSRVLFAAADTKAEAAGDAVSEFAFEQELDRLEDLRQRPGNEQKLEKAMSADPYRLLPSPKMRWRNVRTPSGQVVPEMIHFDNAAWLLASVRHEERVMAPPKGTPWPVGPRLPSFLTANLIYEAKGNEATLKLSGPTAQVLRRLKKIARTKPDEDQAAQGKEAQLAKSLGTGGVNPSQ